MKAIIIPPGKDARHMGEGVYTLITEDGECLASHFCSDCCFAPGDLYTNRPERQPMFEARGISELVWLADSGLTLDELIALNHARATEPDNSRAGSSAEDTP